MSIAPVTLPSTIPAMAALPSEADQGDELFGSTAPEGPLD